MLKHRYNTMSESVSDFNRMLDGMNNVQPLEKSVDDGMLEAFREEQELVRLEQQIEHVTTAINASGMQISKTEASSISNMHVHASTMYNRAADNAERRMAMAKRSGNDASVAKMGEVHKRLRRMAKSHQAKAQKQDEAIASGQFVESTQAKQPNSLMSTMRRLAGIEESVQMPRDPGLLGTTRFNVEYDQMAEPFDDGGGSKQSKPSR